MIETLARSHQPADHFVLNADLTSEDQASAVRFLLQDLEWTERPGIIKVGAGVPWLNNRDAILGSYRAYGIRVFADLKLSEDPSHMQGTVSEIFRKRIALVSVASHAGRASLRAAALAQDEEHKVVVALPHTNTWQRWRDMRVVRAVNRQVDEDHALKIVMGNARYIPSALRYINDGIGIATGVREAALDGRLDEELKAKDVGDHPYVASPQTAIAELKADFVSTGTPILGLERPDDRLETYRRILENIRSAL